MNLCVMTDKKKEPIAFEIALEMPQTSEERLARLDKVRKVLSSSKSTKEERQFAFAVFEGLVNESIGWKDLVNIERQRVNRIIANLNLHIHLPLLRELKCFVSGMITNSAVLGDAIHGSHLNSLTTLIDKLEPKDTPNDGQRI